MVRPPRFLFRYAAIAVACGCGGSTGNTTCADRRQQYRLDGGVGRQRRVARRGHSRRRRRRELVRQLGGLGRIVEQRVVRIQHFVRRQLLVRRVISSSSGGRMTSDGGADQIVCGAAGPCDSKTQVCCAARTGRTCTPIGMCAGDALACSGSNSCTSGVCCEELTAAGTIKSVCATACPAGSRQLCTTEADCRAGQRCVRGADGYAVCVAVPMRDAAAD